MPRIARMIVPDQKTVYHVMSRSALDGYPFSDVDKDELVFIIKRLSKIYFADILGYCIMGNHFHLLVRTHPAEEFSDEEIKKRYRLYYGDDKYLVEDHIPLLRAKWSSLSEFIREIKQTFSRYYNKHHGRRGTLWGERFKSLIVENGETLINCLAYIDLNPIRAGIAARPEDYRWSSMGYHFQTGNKDDFLSWDFGLTEFGVSNKEERLLRYRKYVYETGAIKNGEERSVKGEGRKGIKRETIEKERRKGYQVTRMDRFLYRTRYFSDSGIIGSKAFVSRLYHRFQDHFQSVHEKKPKRISGLEGIYSLKHLSEA